MQNCSTNSIRTLLISLGFRPNLSGFDYLATALNICAEQPEHTFSITKEIYPSVAKKHGSTIPRTERNIRNCITRAKEKPNSAFRKVFDPYKPCNLTNSLVISVLLEKLKNQNTAV